MEHKTIKEHLTEKDTHCIARLLQGSIFEDDFGYCCRYCQYSEECIKTLQQGNGMYMDVVRKKLQDISGLNLDKWYNPENKDEKFSYHK